MVGARLDRLAERLDEPLIVAIAGKVKAGKSTLLNALVGEQLAPTDAGECTRIVTWYRNGPTYHVTIESDDGTERQVPFLRDEGALEVDLGRQPVERIRRMTVDWPSARLSDLTLIDTPGLESVSTRTSDRTHTFLGTDGESHAEADAVIYLMKHLHRADIGFLEAFRDDADATASPISAISVLSRADEVGVCRLDAMVAAHRIATTWKNDPRLRRLCQTVVPVAGLVAEAGASLTEQEFQALRTIARLPRPQVDALLLTVDRFVDTELDELTPMERELLLERFGVFGIRLSVSLIRLGAADHARMLADELWRRSGVEELRLLLGTVFAERPRHPQGTGRARRSRHGTRRAGGPRGRGARTRDRTHRGQRAPVPRDPRAPCPAVGPVDFHRDRDGRGRAAARHRRVAVTGTSRRAARR